MRTATTRTTFSTSYYCRQSKQNKAGLAPLELCIIINGDRVNLNLPVKFYPKDFNKKRKPVEIDNIVDQYRTKVNEAIGDIMAMANLLLLLILNPIYKQVAQKHLPYLC